MADFVQTAMDTLAAHREWAAVIMAALAFGESLAFLSLLIPATVILVGSGALVANGTLDWRLVIPAAIAGASLGDAVSYWVGRIFRDDIAKMWPFTRHPELLERGHIFFARYGGTSVFIGRFFGPLRAVVPLVAGMMDMPHWRFQVANIGSAIVWVPALLAPGFAVGSLIGELSQTQIVVLLVLLVVGGLGFGTVYLHRQTRQQDH
ncbi:membrane-associated protein [uncultured Gammaproteobacteria bacterium]